MSFYKGYSTSRLRDAASDTCSSHWISFYHSALPICFLRRCLRVEGCCGRPTGRGKKWNPGEIIDSHTWSLCSVDIMTQALVAGRWGGRFMSTTGLVRVPWSILAVAFRMFWLHLRKKDLFWVYDIKTSVFQTLIPSCLQLPSPAGKVSPRYLQLDCVLRLFSQLESFISGVFIFFPIYLTTSSISLTPHKPYPSLTRQTNWQCCQNRIK